MFRRKLFTNVRVPTVKLPAAVLGTVPELLFKHNSTIETVIIVQRYIHRNDSTHVK